MKASRKIVPILGLALLLSACSGDTPDTQNTPTGNTPVATPEMKELSSKMIQASKDLTKTQVIGNTSFKSYEKLTIKYGVNTGNLSQSKEFAGKDGFVVLADLKPDTEYAYEIYNNTTKISNGTVKTQKK